MKKIVFLMIFALMLSACASYGEESVPEFGVEGYFTATEMEHELQFAEFKDEYLGLLGFQIFLPEDWHYGILESPEGVGEMGIDFWPPGSGGEVLQLRYFPEPFGVCGTGLVEAEGELPGTGKLRVGYYDGHDYPSFISFYDSPGQWVLLNNMGESWNAHWSDIEKILGSLVLDPGVVRMSLVDEIAAQYDGIAHDYLRKSFDIHSGEFTVDFCLMGGKAVDSIIISSQGAVLESNYR